MSATTVVLAIDVIAAFIFVVLMTMEGRKEKGMAGGRAAPLILARRALYCAISITLAYRAWDILTSGREISFIGAATNIVLVLAVLGLAAIRAAVHKADVGVD